MSTSQSHERHAEPAVVLDGVTKSFRDTTAVRGLSLQVPRGALYGFIGPNGAGKTTTIRMILSIFLPDAGELRVLGHASALEAKDRIGYLPEERGLYRRMRVGALLSYLARLKGLRGPGVEARIAEWLERVELGDVANRRCEELSKGMQQKIQFLAAVLHEPELLILDEPFSGLDPLNMRLLTELILEQHRRGVTILFSTHVMPHAERICERVVMIDEGVKVLDDSIPAIRAAHGPRAIRFETLHVVEAGAALAGVPGISDIESSDGVYQAQLGEDADPQQVLRAIAARLALRRIELKTPTLEDVFLERASATRRRRAASGNGA